jgi:uncharacterized membrane protein
MTQVVRSVEVHSPVDRVYDQWLRFDEYPRFLSHVDAVQALPGGRLHWVATMGGERREWLADLVEQQPKRRLSWVGKDRVHEAAVLTFEEVEPQCTRVTMALTWRPEGFGQRVDDASPGRMQDRVEQALESFKGFMEVHGDHEPQRVVGQLSPLH